MLLGPAPAPLDGELAIGAASLAELHFGVLVARSDDVRAGRLRRLGVIERTFEALPVDAATARHSGRLAAAVTGQARARVTDLLIAATAAAQGARLATRNAQDLAGVEHLVEIVDLT